MESQLGLDNISTMKLSCIMIVVYQVGVLRRTDHVDRTNQSASVNTNVEL